MHKFYYFLTYHSGTDRGVVAEAEIASERVEITLVGSIPHESVFPLALRQIIGVVLLESLASVGVLPRANLLLAADTP
jgi:hypothetical protein